MFEFDKFPAKLRYEKLNAFDEVILERDVELFGFITCCPELPGVLGDYKESPILVAFRETDDVRQWLVCFLPIAEFNERFKDYVVVKSSD